MKSQWCQCLTIEDIETNVDC